ncbi:SpoIIE family protein phosphatase [Streptosporangium sp. NPDC087985]|uniref:SpoIIE family protein phosphatase n=1 Tax=Streptosporangium sp. NPDC087985 TaxID=3366196 RepID=UPI00382F345C
MTDPIGLQALEQALDALTTRVSSLCEARSAYPADPRSTLDAALAELDTARELLGVSLRELRKAPRRSGERESGSQRELKLLRQVFRTFPVPVVVLDASGTVRRISVETSQMLGSPAGYLIGRSFPLLVDVSRRAAFRSHLTAVQQGGQPATFQTRLAHRGRAHTVQLAVTRLTMPGEPQEMTAVVILPLEAQVAGVGPGPVDRSDASLIMAAARRQELLSGMTRLLLDEESLRQPVTVTRAARLLAAGSADWVIADVIRDGVPRRACVLGPGDKPVTDLIRLVEGMTPLTAPAIARVLTGGSGVVHEMLEEETLLGEVPGGPPLLRVMGAASVLIVPIQGEADALGSLTLVRLRDREPFSLADLGLMEEIGVHLGLALRARRGFQTRSQAADALRTSVVPRTLPDIPGFEASAIYHAGSSPVGAEFYDVFPVRDGWGFALGGAAGKGEEAASVSAMVRNGLRVLSVWESDPGEALRKLNHALTAQHSGMFVMAVAGFVQARTIRLASAGHHPAALLQPDGGVRFAAGGGVPLGIASEAEMFTEELTLTSGQTLVFYSDGLVASQNERGEPYGESRLADVLARCVGQSPATVVGAVEEDRHAFSQGRVWDEIVILALRVV